MKERLFSSKIVEWYQEHHRVLPWRKTRDPYKIWLSEIILQQTRVNQGLPYYKRFIHRFPKITELASAPEREILLFWQGLGYYSRARNLRKCAGIIVRQHDARFPNSFAELKKLPGIGDYTAAAIASFAFDEKVAVIDGNVFRVLARIFGIDDDIGSTKGKKKFAQLANRLIDGHHPGLHNQAVMEFGALNCTPRNPTCDECIFRRECVAFQKNLQDDLPVKRKAAKSTHRYFYYFVAKRRNQWLLKKRTRRDIWTGLYDFPLHEGKARMTVQQLASRLHEIRKSSPTSEAKLLISPTYKHVLSHQVIHARFIQFDWPMNEAPSGELFGDASFYSVGRIARLPKPVLINRFLQDQSIL